MIGSAVRRACGVLAGLAAGCFACGCDPSESPPLGSNGPPLVVLGRLASSADAGTTLYVQARGGNWVEITTEGCTHSMGTFSGATRSCGPMPYYGSAPLYFTADSEERPCIVEARLYSICDCDDAGAPSGYTADQLAMWCETTGTLTTTQFLTLGAWPADASDEGDVASEGDVANEE